MLQGLVRRGRHRRPDVGLHAVEFLGGGRARVDEKPPCLPQGIAAILRLPLGRSPVHGLVVRSGMGVRAGRVGVQQRRSPAFPAPRHGLARGPVAFEQVGPVTLDDLQIREAGEQPRYVAAGGLHLDRDRDRVLVVLDQEQDGQLEVAGRVERLPELALRGGSVARGAEHDLVVREGPDVVPQFGCAACPESGFSASHGVQELRPRG